MSLASMSATLVMALLLRSDRLGVGRLMALTKIQVPCLIFLSWINVHNELKPIHT